jgi:hypothetical protein
MSSASALDPWRRLFASAAAALRGVSVAPADRAAFHQELEAAAAERMSGFCWLLFVLHVLLLVRDVMLDVARLPAAEALWSRWLFALHVAITLASGLALVLLASLKGEHARSRVAFLMTAFLLAWSGLVSGADQLIGYSGARPGIPGGAIGV